jgi:hypothetical protein
MRARANVAVLLGYTAVSFLYFGLRLVSHPGRAILGSGRDPQIFIWSFAWWPHAIGAGQNPFVSHAIYAPDGINLAWATTVPALALAFTPVTVLFGPVVSYNLAALLMPALAAWTAYLLCRYLTGSLWASLAGGYLFGFSGYMLGQQLAHLHMTAVFLLPLVALAVLRFIRGELDGRGVAWRLGVLMGLQFWLSTELFFTATLALGAALVLAFWLVPDVRNRLRALIRPLLAGSGIAALVAGPLAVYAALGFTSGSINDPRLFNGDLLEFVVPTRLIALGGSTFGGISSHFPTSDAERGAYLGLPTLLIVGWFATRARRSAAARFLLVALLLSALVTLGTKLLIRGHVVASLPWDVLVRLPLFNNVLPVRIALFGSLAAAVIVALWTASRRGWSARVLPALAVAALVPAVWHSDYRSVPERWPFFTDGLYKLCIPRNENVAIFPYGFWGNSMLWQAESGFWFRMAEGYLRPKPPPPFLADPTVTMLTFTIENPKPPAILAFARNKKVDRILSVLIYPHPSSNQMHRFGAVQLYGGVLISPACGYPSLQRGVHPTSAHPVRKDG